MKRLVWPIGNRDELECRLAADARHDQPRRVGSAIVDVAIDQGGCIATSLATTHQDPTYIKHGVVHYCVANMPGGVARTSTLALNNATLRHAVAIANKGWKQALRDDTFLQA